MPPDLLDDPMTDGQSKTTSVKLRTETVNSARIVASYRLETITDLLSDILDPILAKMEQEEVAKRGKAKKGKGEK